MGAAQARGASIFACEAHKVFHSWRVGKYFANGGYYSDNVVVFRHIWEQVFDDGVYESHDWTLKVDPGCVWSPGRLRSRLLALHVNTDEAVYVLNAPYSVQFLGALEIISVAAAKKLSTIDLEKDCPEVHGEDGWLKVCMNHHS